MGVKRKEEQEENTEAKRARRGAGERHQRTGWFLVTEPDIRQQRIKVKQRLILQEEVIKQIHKIQYPHILTVASLQYDLFSAQQREQVAGEEAGRSAVVNNWVACFKQAARQLVCGRRAAELCVLHRELGGRR